MGDDVEKLADKLDHGVSFWAGNLLSESSAESRKVVGCA
jgi:hypothetical protein